MKQFAPAFAALVSVLLIDPARAGDAPTIYVGSFEAAEASSKSGFAPLHVLTSGLRKHKQEENAERLAASLVRALNAQHVAAEALPNGEAPPTLGWIVRGVFYSLDSDRNLISVPFLNNNKSLASR